MALGQGQRSHRHPAADADDQHRLPGREPGPPQHPPGGERGQRVGRALGPRASGRLGHDVARRHHHQRRRGRPSAARRGSANPGSIGASSPWATTISSGRDRRVRPPPRRRPRHRSTLRSHRLRPRRPRRSPGTWGRWGRGRPRVTQRSMWLSALATGRTAHVVGPDRRVGDLPAAVACPGDSSRIQARIGGDGTRRRNRGSDLVERSDDAGETRRARPGPTGSEPCRPRSPSSQIGVGRSRSSCSAGHPATARCPGGARGCRSAAGAGPCSRSSSRGRPSSTSSRPSLGWPRGATSQRADPLGVHHGHDSAPPPAPPGHQVGDEPVQAAVDQHRAEVDGQAHRLGAAEPALVAACRPTVRHRSPPSSPSAGIGSPARRARLRRRLAPRRRCARRTPSAGSGPGSPHGWPFSMVTRAERPARSARDRRSAAADLRRGRDDAAEQALGGRRAAARGLRARAPPRRSGAAGR